MLTSLGGGLLSFFSRRFTLTIWLPSLLFWSGITSLAVTGTGWGRAAGWWLRQPGEFKIVLTGLALAWITFCAYLLAALLPSLVKMAEGYWPRWWPWAWLARCRREAHVTRHTTMQQDPAELARLYLDYPLRESRVMPTRLGNILRSAEDHALDRYKINSVIVWPRLYMLLPDRFVAAIAAARTPLDLMTALAALATLFAASGAIVSAFLLPWYAPLSCLAAGLLITWMSYLGAVQAAYPYAQLIRAAFDVHRGLLLDEMQWTRPSSYAAEQRQWEQISHLWYQGAPEGAAGAAQLGYPGTNKEAAGTGNVGG